MMGPLIIPLILAEIMINVKYMDSNPPTTQQGKIIATHPPPIKVLVIIINNYFFTFWGKS